MTGSRSFSTDEAEAFGYSVPRPNLRLRDYQSQTDGFSKAMLLRGRRIPRHLWGLNMEAADTDKHEDLQSRGQAMFQHLETLGAAREAEWHASRGYRTKPTKLREKKKIAVVAQRRRAHAEWFLQYTMWRLAT